MSRVTSWLLGLLCVIALPAYAQTVEYIHTDALGTPVAVTDASRNVIERSEYEPYGALLNRPSSDGPGYTGHVQDAATGLTYMQQRYYDPTLGRFLSVDPINADSNTGAKFNRYAYALNNPYKFTDPDGRDEERAYGAGVAIALRNSPERLETVRQAEVSAGRGEAVAGIDGGKGMVEAGRVLANGGGLKQAAGAVAAAASGVAITGRGKNRLGPDSSAAGAHSTLKRDSKGNITNTATYDPNSKNPSGFQEVKRVDVTGAPHTNPDGTKVSTPHVSEAGTKGVRPARPDELPRDKK